MTPKLNDDDMLELDMACNRGGNDWLDALDEYGCQMLADLQTSRAEIKRLRGLVAELEERIRFSEE